MKSSHSFSRYATVNSTNVLSSHWFCFVWLAYSGNKFFRVGPNISEKCVWEEPILGGSKLNMTVQLVPLYVLSSNMAAISLASQTLSKRHQSLSASSM